LCGVIRRASAAIRAPASSGRNAVDAAGMTVDRVDGTTDAAIEVIGATEETGEAIAGLIAEVTGEVTGDAGVLSAADTVRTAGIMAGTHHSAVRNSFPKC